MRKCDNPSCGNSIPNRMWVDGKMRVMNNRKLCLQCSPFGKHNTKSFGYVRISDAGRNCPACNKIYKQKGVLCPSCLSNARRFNVKKKAIELLGGKCVSCGYSKCPASLEFHHKEDGKKEFSISQAYTLKWERILSELQKCELICSNCHAEKHWNEFSEERKRVIEAYESFKR